MVSKRLIRKGRRMHSGFANANYRLETSAGIFLLRHCAGRDRDEVKYELDVLDWLRSHQFPSSATIRFQGGDRWITGPGDSFLVLLEWLDGSEPAPNDTIVRTIARALARLHQLPPPSGEWWRRENPNGWETCARWVQSIAPDDPPLFQFFVEEFAQLKDQLRGPLPVGFVHTDIFTDNTLFWNEQLVGILDFEAL